MVALTDAQAMALNDALDTLATLPPIIEIPARDGGRIGNQVHVGAAAATIALILKLNDEAI